MTVKLLRLSQITNGGEGSGEHEGHEFRGNQYGEGLGKTSTDKKTISFNIPRKEGSTTGEPIVFSPKKSPEQLHSVSTYKGRGYERINNGLRSGKINRDNSKDVRNIDDILSKSTLSEDTTVYRGLGSNTAEKLILTNTCKNQGFTSTSLNPKSGLDFAGVDKDGFRNMMTFEVKKGSNAYYYDGEDEVLLPRNLVLKATKVEEISHLTTDNVRRNIQLDYGKVRIFHMEVVVE